jgi:NTP pyrophosphatase (non-canonical NTP hydrolase)
MISHMEVQMILNAMVQEITDTARKSGWEENWNDYEKLALCHSEISEALEELRNGHAPCEVYFNEGSAKPEGFGIELADCIIRIAHICGHHGVDLDDMLRRKMAYNKTRPYRHGGKKA